jgi:DNA-binding NarL/FixJ family response regulator
MQLHEVAHMDALSRLLSEESAITLLHITLPGLEGIKGVSELKKNFPDSKLIIFSDKPSDDEGVELLLHGDVYGYVSTDIANELLLKAIESVQTGEIWVGRKLMQKLLIRLFDISQKNNQQAHDIDLSVLTKREHEIALLVSEGASNKRVANQLDVTERTVKAHLSSIFRKTGMRDRLQLALLVSGSNMGRGDIV